MTRHAFRIPLALSVGLAAPILLGAWFDAPTPEYKDTGVQQDSDFGRAPGARGPVGLVITKNTNMSVENLEENVRRGESFIMRNGAMLEDLDPVYMHAKLLAVLKSRYPNVRLAPSVAASMRSGNALTVETDVRTALGKFTGQTTSVAITLVFKDAKGRTVGKVSGQGREALGYPAVTYKLQEAADGALAQVASKL
ncbi:hypothetical protein FV219_00680 [Methylobacterium sp. WL122]|nr:hypothetical protein FV219_00680 [Methylobacterium sp. WL122]